MKVKLFTESGGFVTDLTILPFVTPPKILQWGARFFVLTRHDTAPGGEDVILYNEAFYYCAPVEVAGA